MDANCRDLCSAENIVLVWRMLFVGSSSGNLRNSENIVVAQHCLWVPHLGIYVALKILVSPQCSSENVSEPSLGIYVSLRVLLWVPSSRDICISENVFVCTRSRNLSSSENAVVGAPLVKSM